MSDFFVDRFDDDYSNENFLLQPPPLPPLQPPLQPRLQPSIQSSIPSLPPFRSAYNQCGVSVVAEVMFIAHGSKSKDLTRLFAFIMRDTKHVWMVTICLSA